MTSDRAALVRCVVVCILVFCLFGWLVIKLRQAKERSYESYLVEVLKLSYKAWIEAGLPEGEELTEFARKKCPSNLVLSNRMFQIGGTNFTTIFAACRPGSMYQRTVFVTRGGVVVRLWPSGRVEILPTRMLETNRVEIPDLELENK